MKLSTPLRMGIAIVTGWIAFEIFTQSSNYITLGFGATCAFITVILVGYEMSKRGY